MKKYTIHFAILLIGLAMTQTALADVKVKIRQTMSGQTYENTTYIKGKRQRDERNMGTMQMVSLTHCDLKRSVQLMPASQTYLINAWDTVSNVEPSQSVTKTQTPTTKGGVITTTYTTKDTGERKQMFGYTAKHLIITMESESSPDACTPMKSKMQTDGWYIDAEFALECAGTYYERDAGKQNGGCKDRYQSKQIGTAKRGYPVYEKMTMFDESGKETYSFVNEVVELSKTPLDAALFEIPAGYREVQSSSELYGSMSSQSATASNASVNGISRDDLPASSSAGMNSNIQSMANQNSSSGEQAELGAKREGVVRIGLTSVKTLAAAEGIDPQQLSAAIQNTLAQYLKTPQVEVVQLEAKLPSAIDEEAKTKECDFVIYAGVSHKKGGGGMFGKVMGNMAASTISRVGYGSTGAAIARDVAATAIYTAASMSGNIKSKDEIALDVKLQPVGGAAATLEKKYKQKAKSDGEDIISPIIEQAAQAIVDAVAQK